VPSAIAIPELDLNTRDESLEVTEFTLPLEGLQEELQTPTAQESAISERISSMGLPDWLLVIYLLGVGVFAAAFLLQLIVVLRKRRGLATIRDGGFTIYILEHEKLHVAQAHTLDKVLAEMVVVALWFNPFAWMMRTAITKNLEYLTDAEMLDAGTDATSYQLSLVKVSVPEYALSFSTNYNESFLKSRVMMMNSKKSSASSSWKYLLLLPILLLSVLSLNATRVDMQDGALPIEAVADSSTSTPNVKGIPIGAEDHEDQDGVWNKEHRETITRSFAASKNMSLDVHNITGEVKVMGYDGDEIKVTLEKVIKAKSDSDLQLGIQEVKLGSLEKSDYLYLYHDAPYTSLESGTGNFELSNCNGGNCYNYQFYLHYQIMVPYNTNLKLSTINGGDILVQKVESESIEARHISGSVYMKEVAGVREVYTISGHIEVGFTKNPVTPTSFVSTSGYVKLDLQDGFGGEVTYSTLSGKLHSSFPVNGKKADKPLGSSSSPVRIGSGGERMELRSISGSLYLN